MRLPSRSSKAAASPPRSFHVFHPGGRLGASLHFVRDIMHRGDALPLAPLGTVMGEAIVRMTEKGFGCLGIVDAKRRAGRHRHRRRPPPPPRPRPPGAARRRGDDAAAEDHLAGHAGRRGAGDDEHRRRPSPSLFVVEERQAGRHRPHARFAPPRRGVGANAGDLALRPRRLKHRAVVADDPHLRVLTADRVRSPATPCRRS